MASKKMEYINELVKLGFGVGIGIFALGILQSAISTNATANSALGEILTAFSNFVNNYIPPIFSVVALVLIIWFLKKTGMI